MEQIPLVIIKNCSGSPPWLPSLVINIWPLGWHKTDPYESPTVSLQRLTTIIPMFFNEETNHPEMNALWQ